MLSSEDRKARLEHGCEYFTFKTCVDLTEPIIVTPYGNATKFSINSYSRDVASFICWWTNMVQIDLNGFSGFSNIEFKLVGFEIV